MSAKMRRRRRRSRLKRAQVRWREDSLFFGRGTLPASATQCAVCWCGARAFARDGADLDDFDVVHSHCDELAAIGGR